MNSSTYICTLEFIFTKSGKGKPYIKDRLAFVYNIRKLNSNIK